MKMTWLLTAACLVLAVSAAVGRSALAQPQNVYLFDPITLDAFDQWRPIGRTRVELSGWHNPEDPHFSLTPVISISKAGQAVHGIERRGLGLPLPVAVRFRVFGEDRHLWVVLGDRAGRRVSSRVPLGGIEEGRWCQVEVPLAQTFPVGAGAEPLADLDLIAILTQESAGENYEPGPFHLHLGHFEAVYPAGEGPTNPTFTRQDLEALAAPLGPALERIEALLQRARAAGLDVSYPLVSLTVLKRYRREVCDMLEHRDPFVAERAARFLLECAQRTERELAQMLAHPQRAPHMPTISLSNLQLREGSFFSGERPVMFAGVCGWFNPGQFEELAATGFSALSMEVGPNSTLAPDGAPDPGGLDGIRAVLDAAAQHNMVCDLLLSPHYFPGWAREQWPSTDVTGWRQETNGFMPWTITDPHFREVIARHLAVTVPAVRAHPALLSYDLVNEAWYRPIPDFPAAQWREFRRRHPQLSEWQALGALTTQNVTEFVRWYVEEIHKHDRSHPIHMKTISSDEVLNVDREAVGDVLTANGLDAMPSWPDWSGRLAADFAWPLLRHDFHRCLTPDKPIMDGEYHISGGTYPMPAAYVRAALWALALHGRDLSSCWVYDRVDDVSVYWHPQAVETLGHTALDFRRLGAEIHAFQRQRSPLAIHYGGEGVAEAYRACLFQDLDVGVLTDRRIEQGRLADYRVLVIPAGAEPSGAAARRLRAFEQAGGQVVRCPAGAPGEDLWPVVRRAVEKARLARPVAAGEWGIECRSVVQQGRRLFYVLNHRREPVEVRLRSRWPLAQVSELRTGRALDARRLRLEPLEIVICEAG